MSKRRDLKKEKALRNKAYARKFRKTSSKRYSYKRYQGQGSQNSSNSSNSATSAEDK